MRSLYYCLFAPHICGVVLCTHPGRGESHNQRNANGEVATLPRQREQGDKELLPLQANHLNPLFNYTLFYPYLPWWGRWKGQHLIG